MSRKSPPSACQIGPFLGPEKAISASGPAANGQSVPTFSYSYSAERYSYSTVPVLTHPIFNHERRGASRLSTLPRLIQRPAPVAAKATEYEYRSAEYEYE